MVSLSKIPGYDIERTHTRLLVGIDQLWVAYNRWQNLIAVIITSISQRPPSNRKCFRRKDPALMRSLTIHLTGKKIKSWLPSAIERIGLYARAHQCRQLFIMTGKSWQRLAKGFYSREWEGVAITRDRPTKSKCKRLRSRNTPGYFRPFVPVPADQWDRYMYNFTGTAYFKETAR